MYLYLHRETLDGYSRMNRSFLQCTEGRLRNVNLILKSHRPGDCEGQESLPCCSPWDCEELAMTEWLNNK